VSRCAHCEAEVPPEQAALIEMEHGTSASPTLIVHADLDQCAPVVPTRRTT
jgi:hypothetical protein